MRSILLALVVGLLAFAAWHIYRGMTPEGEAMAADQQAIEACRYQVTKASDDGAMQRQASRCRDLADAYKAKWKESP